MDNDGDHIGDQYRKIIKKLKYNLQHDVKCLYMEKKQNTMNEMSFIGRH